MNLHQDFKTVKQVLIEQQWMFNKILKKRKENIYKERSYNYSIIHSFFFKIYHVIDTGNEVNQMEPLRDTTD